MKLSDTDDLEWTLLQDRLRQILPEQYQDRYDEVAPTSMGSAALLFDSAGRVAWDQMWGSFCDLAMAGGPPHRSRLLEPGGLDQSEANSPEYMAVYTEIARGIELATRLAVEPPSTPGWIRVHCAHSGMAGWLERAITMENVSVRSFGPMLELPVGVTFRLEKEIKNVITVAAKTVHYWTDHIPPIQQRKIANLFARMDAEAALLRPGSAGIAISPERYRQTAKAWEHATGMPARDARYNGWTGLTTPSVSSAIWLMRALVASNILARREETDLFLPINPEQDAGGERVTRMSDVLCRLHRASGVQIHLPAR